MPPVVVGVPFYSSNMIQSLDPVFCTCVEKCQSYTVFGIGCVAKIFSHQITCHFQTKWVAQNRGGASLF
jgi:hypothetical protein